MNNLNFWADTDREIKSRLLADSPKAKEHGDKIDFITCPVCGKPEAYAHAKSPRVVMCHRFNQCGEKTLTRHLYGDLFQNFGKRFKKTKVNPRATAEAYLQARGLDTSLFEFSQGHVVDNKKGFPSVKIEFDGVTFQRLIDYNGPNKNRLTAYKGKYFATKGVKAAKKVFVVEGIFNALSLQQAGLPAIAMLSSGHNPESCFAKGVRYVLAFDNDNAGHKAIKKFSAYLYSKKIKYSAALPPSDKDWNDLLNDGALDADAIEITLKDCEWRGRLAMAATANDYFQIYYEKYPRNISIFEFNKQTYKGIFKEGDEKKEPQFITCRILDCTLKIAYSIEDASIRYESKIQHIIVADSKREGLNRIRFRGSDFSNLGDFKSKLLQYRLLFFGNGVELTLLAEHLFKKKPVKIRECQALGYDRDSGCYVFNHFLYDENGKHHPLDDKGYFEKQKIMPFVGQDKAISKTALIDVGRFIVDIHNAYGDKGLLALGFWVSSAFSHVIYDQYGFFPFLSFYGDPHCGKSDLTTTLNRCFFIDSEGLTMSSTNTKKGELRAISQKSSMVTALLEGRKDKTRFDYDSILPLYNRNALQVRAQTTNDNQVHELKFNGTLAFVQNVEQFISKPAKERVVSIRFSNEGLDNTYEAWKRLKVFSPEQLAGIGHYVLANRKTFEEGINDEIKDVSEHLRNNGVTIDRVAKNHAVCVAGTSILIDLAKPECRNENLLGFALNSALSKIETARSELFIAEHFMQCIDGFTEKQGVYRDDDFLIVDMPTALTATGENWQKSELFNELKQYDQFIELKASRVFDKTIPKKCWHFKNENLRLQSYKPWEAA